jgi:hypothetical protein
MTDVIVSIDNKNELLYILDSTDYASIGITVNDVNGIRLMFSTYYSIANKQQVTSLKANNEYKVISGTLLVNNVSYTSGMIFTAYEDFDFISQTCVIEETGWYGMPNLNLPKSNLENTYTPSQVNELNENFLDAFRKVRYDIYTKIVASGDIEDIYTYLVQGTLDSSITLGSGEVYYVGQTFVPSSNFNYTSSGTAYAVEFKDTSTNSFWTDFNAQTVKASYNKLLNNPTYTVSEDFRANYISCVSCVSLPYILSYVGQNYSEADIQNELDFVNGILEKNKDIRNA